MFSGLSNYLKKILPKRLFYRALLIVAIPVLVLQLIITRLRKKIEIDPKNPKFLQTIRGAGYVLWIEWLFKKNITKKIIL